MAHAPVGLAEGAVAAELDHVIEVDRGHCETPVRLEAQSQVAQERGFVGHRHSDRTGLGICPGHHGRGSSISGRMAPWPRPLSVGCVFAKATFRSLSGLYASNRIGS